VSTLQQVRSIVIVVIVAGMEEIGVENEEPFSILPLEVIANKAKADIIELMNKQEDNRDFSAIRYDYVPEHSVFEHV
jgi:predicted membrane chloride channel (bestrophin family)